MAAKLTKELSDALHASGDESLEVIDPDSQRMYVIVDCATHRRAMAALCRERDREAIAEGLAQLEAGEAKPIDESFEGIRTSLGFPKRS